MREPSSSEAAVIFDFNGVLLWDSELHEAAWNHIALSRRGRLLTEDELSRSVHGRTNRQVLEYVMGHALSDAEALTLADEKEAIYRRRCLDLGEGFRLSPGAADLLQALRERRVPYTIATSSGRENLEFFITHLDLESWFDCSLIVFDDGTFPGKPAPDIYVKAAARLAVAVERCAVIEDALSGIAAAREAGIGRIVALGPPDKWDTLRALPGVSRVVSSLTELTPDELVAPRRA
jgi:HAD superfamily hydrolase (TIGR01509 family)